MAMAVQLPALKKLGQDLGLSLDEGLAGMARGVEGKGAEG